MDQSSEQTVCSLQTQLKTQGLPTTGLKKDLLLRVRAITDFVAWCSAADWSGNILGGPPRLQLRF